MSEINPDHPVTATLRGHWHKVLALHMRKAGIQEFTLTPDDMGPIPGGLNVVAIDRNGTLTFRIVNDADASKLAMGG